MESNDQDFEDEIEIEAPDPRFRFARTPIAYQYYWAAPQLLSRFDWLDNEFEVVSLQEASELRDKYAPISEAERQRIESMTATEHVQELWNPDGQPTRALNLWDQWAVPWRAHGKKVFHVAQTWEAAAPFHVREMDSSEFVYEISIAYAELNRKAQKLKMALQAACVLLVLAAIGLISVFILFGQRH